MIDEEDVNGLWLKVIEADGVLFRDNEDDTSAGDHMGLALIHSITWTDLDFDEIIDLPAF